MENKYYIYAHINPLKNEIFYIGKGKKDRAYRNTYRNRFWNFTVKKYGYIVDILEEGLTEQEAFEREIFYITKIGRRDLGTGPLVNLTDGGDGGSNRVLSFEIKEKLSKLNKIMGTHKTEQTKKEIYSIIEGWNLKTEGKITQRAVTEKSGKSIITIKRYWPEFKEFVSELNRTNLTNDNPKKVSEPTQEQINEIEQGKEKIRMTKKRKELVERYLTKIKFAPNGNLTPAEFKHLTKNYFNKIDFFVLKSKIDKIEDERTLLEVVDTLLKK